MPETFDCRNCSSSSFKRNTYMNRSNSSQGKKTLSKLKTSIYGSLICDFSIRENQHKFFKDMIAKSVEVLLTFNIPSFAGIAEKG